MTARDDIRAMLVDNATRVFADHVDAKALDAAKRDGWSSSLWSALESAELPRISIPEDRGGAGGTLSDAAAVLRVAGRHSAPVPLAETALLAGWMLASSGLPVPRGALAAGPVHGEPLALDRSGGEWMASGSLSRVPWARTARFLVLFAEHRGTPMVVRIDPALCDITPGRNLAHEPRDDVLLDRVAVIDAVPAGDGVNLPALHQRGALARSVLMAGALEGALQLAVAYARQREQFGRKIGGFQAIQQELARFAGETASAVAAALSAAGVAERRGVESADAALAIGAARIRTADAAREGAMIAHQIHGAVGVTEECMLHHHTLRLWSWREEFGNEGAWATALGQATLALGADELWPALTQT